MSDVTTTTLGDEYRGIKVIGEAISNEVMSGFSGLLTDTRAVAQEVGKIAQEAEAIHLRTTQFVGSFTESMTKMLDLQETGVARQRAVTETVEEATRRAREKIEAPPSTWLPGPAPSGPAPPPTPGPFTPSRPTEQDPYAVVDGQRTSLPDAAIPEERERGVPRMTNEQMAGRAMHYNLSTLRQDAARSAQRRISQISDRPLGYEQHEGQWYQSDVLAEATAGLDPEQAARARAFIPTVDENDRGLGKALRAQRTASIAQNVAGGVAQGQGLKAVLGIAKPVAIAYAAGKAVDSGLDFFENQRAANVEYQRTLGGSNLEAMRERVVDERMFRLGQRGVMRGAEADQLFQGVTSITTDREERREFLDFATEQYRQFGMTVSDSLNIIRTASENGVTSLRGLSDSLERVTSSARAAGRNTEEMRDRFIANFETISNVVSGNQAIIAAEAQTQVQLGLGRNLEDVQMDVTSPQQLRLAASRAGMSPGAWAAHIATPEGMLQAHEVHSDQLQQTVRQIVSRTPEGVAAAENLIARYGPGGEEDLPPGSPRWREVGLQLQQEANIDPEGAIAFLRARGVQGVDVSNYGELLAQVLAGKYDPAAAVRGAQEEGRRVQLTGAELRGPTHGGDVTDELGRPRTGGLGERLADVYEDLGVDPGDDLSTGWVGNLKRGHRASETEDLRREFLSDVQETGTLDPVIQELLEDDRAHERQFEVQVGDETRVVDMSTAMKHFSDQLRSGEAIIAEGQGWGSSVADVTMMSDPDVKVTSDQDEDLARLGLSKKDWEEQRDREGGDRREGVTTVRVEPSPSLLRWFRFTPTGAGSEYTDMDRYQGSPSSAFSPPEHYPGGMP